MAKPPYFPFFPADWLSSSAVAQLTLEEQGAYLNLLCHQWGSPDCTLPADPGVLGYLSRLADRWAECGPKILRLCFTRKGGRVFNERLLSERQKYESHVENGRAGGVKSGSSRRKGSEAESKRKASGIEAESNQSDVRRQTSESDVRNRNGLTAVSEADRVGAPGELETLQAEVTLALGAASQATGRPHDELLVEASTTDRGQSIVNVASCSSVRWLRVARDRLIAVRLRAQTLARGEGRAPPGRASVGEKSLAAAERFIRRGGEIDRQESIREGAHEIGDGVSTAVGRRDP